MTPHVLPASDIDRLDRRGEAHLLLSFMRSEDLTLAVVEHEGRIVGSMGVMRIPHWEGAWIDPEHRGRGGVARALIGAAIEASGPSAFALAGADRDEIRGYLMRLGGHRMPLDYYVMRTRGA